MAELDNCSRCDAVFVKNLRDICKKCFQEEELAFKVVYQFLTERKNREATLLEIVEATEIQEEFIIKFIKEKRLRNSQFPQLTYPCERCGTGIITNKLCNNCSQELLSELEVQEQMEDRAKKRKQREKKDVTTYYSFDKHKK